MDDVRTKFIHEEVYSEFSALPQSDGVVVFHNVWLDPKLRGEGRGFRAHRARLAHAKAIGYRYALCTVNADNAAERRILKFHGWKKLGSYTDAWNNGHRVLIMGKHLDGVTN